MQGFEFFFFDPGVPGEHVVRIRNGRWFLQPVPVLFNHGNRICVSDCSDQWIKDPDRDLSRLLFPDPEFAE